AQQRNARDHRGSRGQHDESGDQAQRSAERDRDERESAEAGDDLAKKLSTSDRRLPARGGPKCSCDADRSEDDVEQRMRVASIAELVRANEQVETERIKGRYGDGRRPERGTRPQPREPRAPGE